MAAMTTTVETGGSGGRHRPSVAWRNTVKTQPVYDNYEISGCVERDDGGGRYVEVVSAGETPDFWTLYGHVDGQGVEAIGDFASREAAEAVFYRITGQSFTGSYEADDRLRLMHAAPKLLAACHMVVDRWENGDLAEAARACHAAIVEALPDHVVSLMEEMQGGLAVFHPAASNAAAPEVMKQQVEITVKLTLWTDAALSKGDLATLAENRMAEAFAQEAGEIHDFLEIVEIKEEFDIYSKEPGLLAASRQAVPEAGQFDQLTAIMAYEAGDQGEAGTLELFQHLVDSGLAWQLQGHYGRTARALLDGGLIEPAADKPRLPSPAEILANPKAYLPEQVGGNGNDADKENGR